jgi:hypothetical protein
LLNKKKGKELKNELFAFGLELLLVTEDGLISVLID